MALATSTWSRASTGAGGTLRADVETERSVSMPVKVLGKCIVPIVSLIVFR